MNMRVRNLRKSIFKNLKFNDELRKKSIKFNKLKESYDNYQNMMKRNSNRSGYAQANNYTFEDEKLIMESRANYLDYINGGNKINPYDKTSINFENGDQFNNIKFNSNNKFNNSTKKNESLNSFNFFLFK